MDIKKYMKEHESYIKEQLLQEGNRRHWNDVKEKHRRVIDYMQHERLIHLMVTLAFGAFLLITMGIAFIKPQPLVLILLGMFFIMIVPYVAHYFFLENSVQRWYKLMDEIEKQMDVIDD